MSWWAVLTTGGRLVGVVDADQGDLARHFDLRGKVAVALARPLADFETVGLDGTIATDLPALAAHLTALVDRERMVRLRAIGPNDPAMANEYAAKAAEADAIATLGGGLATLSAATRATRFPWLVAEADACGRSLEAVAGDVRAARDASAVARGRISGRARKAKLMIGAAVTAAAMRAAADGWAS